MSEPQRFRKKPVVVEAMHHTGSEASADRVLAWVDPLTLGTTFAVPEKAHPERWTVIIETLEGAMAADPGDWIICGVKGEFYPCKPDIFEATYEPVTP